MEKINFNLDKYKTRKEEKTKIVNERQDLIKQFLDRINGERIGTPYKQMTARGVAIKVAHIKTNELYSFYKKCEEYKGDFSKCFFGILRVK